MLFLSESRPHALRRLGTLTQLMMLGLWLRVVAADLVEWTARRRGRLCLFPDTTYYWELAGTILRGGPYEVMDWGNVPHFSLRTPGYPLFLAACRRLFGTNTLPPRLAQAALGAWCVWLLARLVKRALPHHRPGLFWTAPLIAAAIAAVDPFVVGNSAFLLSEALFLPLMLVAQWGLSELWRPEGRKVPRRWSASGWALLTGLASGAAVLTRPSWLLYVPAVIVIWVVLDARDPARKWPTLRGAVIVALGFIVVMAPWWVRNQRIYGKFVPTALWMGASLYDGLNPSANGESHMEFLADPEFWPLDEESQDAALRASAIRFARDNPGRVVTLAAIKAGRFWSPWPNAELFRSKGLVLISALITLPQFFFLAMGVWDRRRDLRSLMLLGFPLLYTFMLHLIFVSSMRYRVPVFVPALGLVAVGCEVGYRRLRTEKAGPFHSHYPMGK